MSGKGDAAADEVMNSKYWLDTEVSF